MTPRSRTMLKSKIHRATVTDADLNYVGSITVDTDLLDAADIRPYEHVCVLNINTGARFETYAIEGPRGGGDICLNGAAARLAQPGDLVIVLTYAQYDEEELEGYEFPSRLQVPTFTPCSAVILEFGANDQGFGDIIQLGDGSSSQNTLAKVPHHLMLSHLYIHGNPLVGQKRCVALNAAHVTIKDSHIAECKAVGQDSQAIGGWNGPGPYVIDNNYLEGAGENILIGGADPSIAIRLSDVTLPGDLVVPEQARGVVAADGAVRGFFVLVLDMTDRVKAERALQESNRRYQILAEVSPYAIFVNIKGRIVYVNQECVKLFGASIRRYQNLFCFT